MVELPSSNNELNAEFEYDQNVTKEDLISFLEELLDQLREDNAVTVSMVGTKTTFPFEEPISLEVESDYSKKLGKRELEIEIEFREDETRT